MKITIIGWYGTETIGDRAILAGILSLLNKTYTSFEINLGSLYPFFSERTIKEDYSFYKALLKKDITINIFDSKQSKELNQNIAQSDLILMGGGPLMYIEQLYMVEYAFKKAKKLNKKTVLFGCGIGPFFTKQYKVVLINIINNSDLVILRDKQSQENLENISHDLNMKIKDKRIFTSLDPSVECALSFLNNQKTSLNSSKYIAINFREFLGEYALNNISSKINNKLEIFLKELTIEFNDLPIKLIPMHYFNVGGDDRIFLNKLAFRLNKKNIEVQNKQLTLVETMQTFQKASFNVGMRFHSIVLQSIVNGNNFILDYTEPKKGKIAGFLNDIDSSGFYDNRYYSLQESSCFIPKNFILKEKITKQLVLDKLEIKKKLGLYSKELKLLMA